ncbi:DUF5819 family protein [Streptomyces sp. CPS1]
MDAYDEDSGAAPGPDGSTGARPPEHAPERLPDGERDTGAAGPAHDGGFAQRGPGREAVGRALPDRQPVDGEPADPQRTGPDPANHPEPPHPPPTGPQPARQGILALSPRYQVAAALAVAAVAVGVGVHLLMVFLSIAPPNAVSKQHGKAVEAWVFPEFEQNWKLFAPNPLQQNIAVQARAEVRTKDGSLITTGWTDLSAQDGAAIRGNLAPSHAQQNELRRAWDFVTATHTDDDRPVGMRGSLSEDYLRRIVVLRLYRTDPTSRDGVIQRVQVRSRTTNVQPPSWSDERVPDKPYYRELPWWTVRADEAAGGVR